jgi:hypothetical protein
MAQNPASPPIPAVSNAPPAADDWGMVARVVGPVQVTPGASTTYAVRVDEASDAVTYVGDATVGSAPGSTVWRIKRLTTAGTELITEWAHGGLSDQAWDDRADPGTIYS